MWVSPKNWVNPQNQPKKMKCSESYLTLNKSKIFVKPIRNDFFILKHKNFLKNLFFWVNSVG